MENHEAVRAANPVVRNIPERPNVPLAGRVGARFCRAARGGAGVLLLPAGALSAGKVLPVSVASPEEDDVPAMNGSQDVDVHLPMNQLLSMSMSDDRAYESDHPPKRPYGTVCDPENRRIAARLVAPEKPLT